MPRSARDGRTGVNGRLLAWFEDVLWLVVATVGAAVAAVLAVLAGVGVLLVPVLGIGLPITAGALRLLRAVARAYRRRAGTLLGTSLPSSYVSSPGATPRDLRACARDPQTWRDLVWVGVNLVLAVVPLLLVTIAFFALLGLLDSPRSPLATAFSLVVLLAVVVAVPWVRHLFTQLAAVLLAPSDPALARRVTELTESRAATADARAAELRRIERDLHDGAQARLASVTMALGLADQVLRSDPDKAAALLREARDDARAAQQELRDLVHGIHPPVLADRGLPGGLEAAALLCPVPVRLDIALPQRPPEPVESALYFAAAEALANVGRHARATTAWLSAGQRDGRLSVVVGDDGCGGADPDGGTGLRGITRRLAPFDGTCRIVSPPGGPTEIVMEVPWTSCAPSSPRTTSSSGTA